MNHHSFLSSGFQAHSQAVDGLSSLFTKSNHELKIVHFRLQGEFQQSYPDHANPMNLCSRIKKIEDELSSLKDQCSELLAAKQELIDKARAIIVGNRSLLQRLQASTGTPVTTDSEDPGFTNFNQVIEEWTAQVRPNTDDKESEEDINQLQFSAILKSD